MGMFSLCKERKKDRNLELFSIRSHKIQLIESKRGVRGIEPGGYTQLNDGLSIINK